MQSLWLAMQVSKRLSTSVGEASGQKAMPHTLTEFGAFYLENPSQARHLFVSDKFKELDFMKDQVQRTALYEGLLEGSSEHQALEAFAVAMELKKPVQLTVQAKTLSFTEEELPQDGIELVVTASTWGWFAAQIKTDVPWLIFPQKKITSRDFSSCFSSFRYSP